MTQRIIPGLAHALHDVASTRQIERLAQSRLPPHALMQRAGLAVARLAMALSPHARHVWIACGPGNNGGDGFEAAARLRAAGRQVSVHFDGDAERLPADARWAFQRARDAGARIGTELPVAVSSQDIFIDALLGMGSSARAAPPGMRAALDALQRAPCPVLAVDMPSGLHAATGQYAEGFAPTCVQVSPRHTLSLLTLKPGLFTGQGRDAAGTVWFDPLGVDLAGASPVARLAAAPDDGARAHASHKGSFGDVVILGGEGLGRRGMGMGGAALLAASAALHQGAGRVLVALLDGNGELSIDTSQPELMLRRPAALDLTKGTVVCGCGGGDAVREWMPRVLQEASRLVLDADALNALAADGQLQSLLRARADRGAATVLTPHPLEAARLLGTSTAEVQADRLAAASKLAQRYGCVAVVKGSGTVIAAAGQVCRVNPTGNGRLATAGTGDVLAGMVGARMAAAESGLPLPIEKAFAAASDAVYRHGSLADQWPADLPLTAGGLARQSPGR